MVREQRGQYWLFFALKLHVQALNYILMSSYFTHIKRRTLLTHYILEKNHLIQVKLERKKLRVKNFALNIELYCKVKNLNFKISLN